MKKCINVIPRMEETDHRKECIAKLTFATLQNAKGCQFLCTFV